MRERDQNVSHDLTRTDLKNLKMSSTNLSKMANDTEENPWYKARELLQQDRDNGHILDDMEPNDVVDWRPEYQAVRLDRFRANFNAWKKRGFKAPATRERKPVNPWYIAKPILQEMYKTREIAQNANIRELHQSREEFKAVDFDKFRNNFSRLKKRIDEDWERAKNDAEGYARDMSLPNHTMARDLDSEWHGSNAQALLRQIIEGPVDRGSDERDDEETGLTNDDIARYLLMKPAELYETHEEFQKFDYKTIFRKQFHQERRRKDESGYWLVKKKKKEKKKLAKLRGEKYKDDDNDFYDPVLDFDNLSNWQ